MTKRTINCLEAEILCAANSIYNRIDWLMGYGISVPPAIEAKIIENISFDII